METYTLVVHSSLHQLFILHDRLRVREGKQTKGDMLHLTARRTFRLETAQQKIQMLICSKDSGRSSKTRVDSVQYTVN